MNAVTRWKTVATIAVAFSAGNLFATACQNAGSGKANASDPSVEADVASIKCFVGQMTDNQWYVDDQWNEIDADGEATWGQGPDSDASAAYEDCF